jgi:homocysteine S-methyltransferase
VQDADGTLLRSGELLEDALRACVPLKPLSVILNCSIPEAIDQGLPLLAQATEIFGAYANGFHSVTALKPGGTVDVLTAREDLTPAAYTEMSLQWLELGASILGGCCEVGPAHIEALAQGIIGKGRQLSGLPAAA